MAATLSLLYFLTILSAATLSLLYFLIIFSVSNICLALAQDENQFIYNGFLGKNLSLDGSSKIHSNGLLQLTNTSQQEMGHAFYPLPMKFNTSSSSISFSTIFVFAMVRSASSDGGHGLAFVIAPSMDFSQAMPTQYLGIFNSTNKGLSTNHVLAVEFDTVVSPDFEDIDNNHVGIDVNDLNSAKSATASYFSKDEGRSRTIKLMSGDPIQAWIDYHEEENQLNVTLAPIKSPKPKLPLLSAHINISEIFVDTMYVGFAASTGSLTAGHYILGWSFSRNGKAQELEFSKLPSLPPHGKSGEETRRLIIAIVLPVALVCLLITVTGATCVYRRKHGELIEEWEQEYGPQRFSYKNLYKATNGFADTQLLGSGGFGKVYRGILASSKQQIAVKRTSHDSRQGMKQFVAEIVSMRRLRHKNLVRLLGYCRRKGELLLVYDYMPNGSLDKFLFRNDKAQLDWSRRFLILKGVASALLYLHEEWEQVVLHRDIKASNVLLDANLNGRLGDFGLSRLQDRGANPQATKLVGTPGYLAPELTRTTRATTCTDVFAFGVFMLEVACGRRPIEHEGQPEDRNLIDWVTECWRRDSILEASDCRLAGAYVKEEMELVLKLGLLCSHPTPASRPSMRQVMQYLDGDVNMPNIQLECINYMFSDANQAFGFCISMPPITSSIISSGR